MVIILIALAVASISYTIATTGIFRSTREFISKGGFFLEGLIHCPYCLGHWIAIIFLIATPFEELYLPYKTLIFNLAINWFAIMAMVAIIHKIMLTAYKPVSKMMRRRIKSRFKDLQLKLEYQLRREEVGRPMGSRDDSTPK